MTEIEQLEIFSNKIRKTSLDMALSAGKAGCHIGGGFSCIEIFAVLYGKILNVDAKDPVNENRDRFIPSKAHCILPNFASLLHTGFIGQNDILSFHENGGLLAGHPENREIGLEFSGGSLGMGLSVGIGMSLAAKRKGLSHKTYVLLGDGECNEGSVWEAFMSAAQFRLDNLIVVVDYNNMQFDGVNYVIMGLAPLDEKLKAFGWQTVSCNGHNIGELLNAFEMPHPEKPLAIIAHTIKAHGIPSLENKAESHHAALSQEDYDFVINAMKDGSYGRI
ncbi:MAG: transketolase [Alphaproteobacteria bacterium]|nr:transketolase [Alphaproteobacteria bacterium]